MKVMNISANVRFSKDTGQGAWKVIELGAEASVDPEEDWTLAQQGLYAMLTTQLRALWPQNGQSLEHSQNGSRVDVEEPPKVEAPRHWCQQHQAEFKKHTKDGEMWYSHRTSDGWCKEQRVMKGVVSS